MSKALGPFARHLKTINSEQMEFIDANGAAAAEKFKHAFEARCAMEGQHFSDPLAAERAARKLAEYGRLLRRCATLYSRKGKPPGRR